MSGHEVDTSTGRRAFPKGFYYPRLGFRGIIFVIVASIGSVALILSAGCSGGEEDKIAFVSDRDGDPEIYIMDPDGSNQTPLTNNGALDGQPRWSPDKKWIAFISDESGDREINLVEVGKEEPAIKRLTNTTGPDSMHRWSPDGSRIAFVSNRDGRPEIYLMDISGARFSRVTSGDSSQLRLTGWSPDGQWLGFILEGAEEEPGIITRNPDGVNKRRLTNAKDLDAAWSPDGEEIAFTSERDGNLEIYVMNSDGSDPIRLTHNTSSDSQPAWSPDGKKLAIVSERDGNAEIYVMNADGSAVTRHTFNNAADESPVWSPDGEKIAFVSYIYGPGEIIVMGADGQNQMRLTNNPADDTQPAW